MGVVAACILTSSYVQLGFTSGFMECQTLVWEDISSQGLAGMPIILHYGPTGVPGVTSELFFIVVADPLFT